MKKTKISIPKYPSQITHHHPICFLGSCFSENISHNFQKRGFYTAENPFGIIYNPISLANNLSSILTQNIDENSFFENDNLYFSWLAHSKIYGTSKQDLATKLSASVQAFSEKLNNATHLFVTLGTAYAYLKSNEIVGNCHKLPQKEFQKELLSTQQIIDAWQPLIERLKDKTIIFTVSPVRHKKDGLIENTRSKSRLIEAVHQLCETKNAFYFPSYEIVLDELRDYAYFGEDGVHPNRHAISTIWNKVSDAFLSPATQTKANKFNQLYQDFQHKILFPESNSAKSFIKKRNEKLESLKLESGEMNFGVIGEEI